MRDLGIRSLHGLGLAVAFLSACAPGGSRGDADDCREHPGSVVAATRESTEWAMPLAPGACVIEYAAVPTEERRGNVVTLQPELVVGGELTARGSAFFHARDVAVDALGRMYVLDSGNHRVQVFDSDGNLLRSLGGKGQGPGELEGPEEVEVTDDRILVWDDRRRLAAWDMEGNPTDDVRLEGVGNARDMALAGGGKSMVVLHSRLASRRPADLRAGARLDYFIEEFSLNGSPELTYLEFPSTFPSRGATPVFAVSGSGTVYVSTTEEYQVHAFPRDGRPWALRVDWPRRSTANEIARMRAFIEENPGSTPESIRQGPEDLGYGELLPALASIRVDGHGHIYVVVNLSIEERRGLQLQPDSTPFGVDVYGPEGRHLFSGVLDGGLWDAAAGDYVYDIGYDEVGEQTLVRSRIREPF